MEIRRPRRVFDARALCAALALAACGKVEFVAPPFAPAEVQAAWSAEEDLTRLRWQVKDASGVAFDLRRGESFEPVDFAAAPYASGPYACAAGTCYQLAVRGRIPRPSNGVLLRARHALGTFLGAPAQWIDVPPPALTLTASLAADAATYSAVVGQDWLAAPGLERRYRVTVWPEPTAPCAPRADLADGETETPPGASLPFTAPLTDEGRYCVRVRPQPTDGGARAAAVAELVTAPLVIREERTYQPPVEESPIVWRLVTDLQVVDPDRCNQVRATVDSTFGAEFAARGVSHELAAVDLAPNCQQLAGRAIDAGPLADETKTWIAAHYAERYHRPILVYVNNLAAPLPPSLTTSLQTWKDSFDGVSLRPVIVAMSTGAALASFQWDEPLQFVAIEDPQFATTISALAQQSLPFQSQIHSPDQVIPLMPMTTVEKSAGMPWKVCQASPEIQRMAGMAPIPPQEIAPAIDLVNPPGFTVALPEKILVPAQQFMRDTVVIRYEICRRWCDHAFRDEAGTDRPAWSTTPVCVRNSVP